MTVAPWIADSRAPPNIPATPSYEKDLMSNYENLEGII